MNRRSFLGNVGSIAGLGLIPAIPEKLLALSNYKGVGMPLGFQSYVFRDEISQKPHETMSRLAGYGRNSGRKWPDLCLADTITALGDPVVKEKLAQAGYTVVGSRPEELRELLKSEIEKWAAVIKAAGIPRAN